MIEFSTDELRKHNLLVPLIRSQIIASAVSDEQIDPEELNRARNEYFTKNGLTNDNDENLKVFMSNNGFKEDDLNWQISLPLRIRSYCHDHFKYKAEARFLNRKNSLDVVTYDLLRVKDASIGRELYLRLEAGEASFADLANQFSEGPEKKTGGSVGPIPLTMAHPALAEKLRTAAPGELHTLQIDEWCIIAKLENYKSALFDDAMANRMSEELFSLWVEEEVILRINNLTPILPAPNPK